MYFDYTNNIEFTPIVSTSDSLVSVSFKYNFVSDRTQYRISRPSSQSIVVHPRQSVGLILHSSLSVQARETPSYSPCTQFDPSFPLQSYKTSRGAPASIVLFVLCTAPIREELAANFQNPYNLDDSSLFVELPPNQQCHNNLSPLNSPIFTPSDLPSIHSHSNSSSNSPHASPNKPTPLPSLNPIPPLFTSQTSSITDQEQPQPIVMASPIYMPARGERAAPTFDKTKPRELTRFFNELEYLFNRAAIESDTDKKVQVVRYVDFEVEEIWKTFPEFKDELKTYQDFKEAILKYYPDASGDYVYSLRDVDLLVGERQRLGINNTNDLSDYHLQFLAITSWLIDKKQLGDLEHQRAYIRAFQPTLLVAIINRLQMKFPDHHPNIPHQIHVVYEAARFVLQGSAIPTQTYSSTFPQHNTTSSISVAKNEPDIKSENFNSLFSEFTKTIERALKENNRRPFTGNTSSPPSRSTGCVFCGGEMLYS